MAYDNPILALSSGGQLRGAWPAEHDPANPAATPDYDDWGWDDYWGPTEWMQWHKAMKEALGKDKADYNFAAAWEKMLTVNGLGASVLSARSFNADFRKWAKSEGLLDALYGGVAWIKPLGTLTDVASGAADAGSALPDIATSAVKWAGLAIGIGLGLAALRKGKKWKR